jgi:HTH-type transcriptional regulator/antitoxin HigA
MDATLILIDSDAELLRARALVDQLWNSNDPADVARLEAQARLVAAYEEMKWPRRPPRAYPAGLESGDSQRSADERVWRP